MTAGVRVLVMAGGTGGHVFPALAAAELLRARGAEVSWVGTRAGLEARLVPPSGIPLEWITVRGLRGKGLLGWLLAPVRLARAMAQAGAIIRRLRPDVVLGMGGFVSGPGGIMARMLRIPLVVHEQNAVPGLTNRILGRIARRVLEAFPGSFDPTFAAETVGNPVRREIAALPRPAERFADRHGPVRVLVIGGSQGARILNTTVPEGLALLTGGERPLIWHQAGARGLDQARQAYADAGVEGRIVPFIDNMAEAYAWADLVICRAGALTVSELAAAGVGSVLVPFAAAVDDHQTLNARYLSDRGAAILIPQSEFDGERLANTLRELGRGRLLMMAQAARAQAVADAAERVVQVCLEAAAGGVA